MGLHEFNWSGDSRLIKFRDTVYKLKLSFQIPPPFVPDEKTQEEIQEVVAAVIHLIRNRERLGPIQTAHFLVHVALSRWNVGGQLRCMQDKQDLRVFQSVVSLTFVLEPEQVAEHLPAAPLQRSGCDHAGEPVAASRTKEGSSATQDEHASTSTSLKKDAGKNHAEDECTRQEQSLKDLTDGDQSASQPENYRSLTSSVTQVPQGVNSNASHLTRGNFATRDNSLRRNTITNLRYNLRRGSQLSAKTPGISLNKSSSQLQLRAEDLGGRKRSDPSSKQGLTGSSSRVSNLGKGSGYLKARSPPALSLKSKSTSRRVGKSVSGVDQSRNLSNQSGLRKSMSGPDQSTSDSKQSRVSKCVSGPDQSRNHSNRSRLCRSVSEVDQSRNLGNQSRVRQSFSGPDQSRNRSNVSLRQTRLSVLRAVRTSSAVEERRLRRLSLGTDQQPSMEERKAETFQQKDRHVIQEGDNQEEMKLQELAGLGSDARKSPPKRKKRKRGVLEMLADSFLLPFKRVLRSTREDA